MRTLSLVGGLDIGLFYRIGGPARHRLTFYEANPIPRSESVSSVPIWRFIVYFQYVTLIASIMKFMTCVDKKPKSTD